MFDRLKSLFQSSKDKASGHKADISTLAPDQHLLVVGDIHGCLDLLKARVAEADRFIEGSQLLSAGAVRLVFVGDYVDRGEESGRVLAWLFQLQQQMPDSVTCLMGNHERMMLEFIDDPAGRGHRWLRNGGLQTLASFGIGGLRETSSAEELTEASHALEGAMKDGMLDWLRALPVMHQSGNVCVVHAAMDPHLAPEDQSRQVLLWGHNEFLNTPRDDGLWVVHGHTIVREPCIAPSRISIDTGAYHSGRLTIAAIGTGTCTFI